MMPGVVGKGVKRIGRHGEVRTRMVRNGWERQALQSEMRQGLDMAGQVRFGQAWFGAIR